MGHQYHKIICAQCKYIFKDKEKIFYAMGYPHCSRTCRTTSIKKIQENDVNFDEPHFWGKFFNLSSYINGNQIAN